MKQRFETRLAALATADSAALQGGLKGIEKESLRVGPDGFLSNTMHPQGLGSALTNRFITTDFSEALLEFVTPAFPSTWEALQCICDIHQFTYAHLGNELLWPASMPCRIPGNDGIPLARYGDSNVGRMKTIYRRGLGFRYGRQMQLIAGVHFNYSLPESFWTAFREISRAESSRRKFQSKHYLRLIRNFRRTGWLILYLFGASPALCKSFSSAAKMGLQSLDKNTYYGPFATSLRMSDLGYSNQNQSRIRISLNSLDEYVRDLSAAICTPEPAYEKIGVKTNGDYLQLNANLLQVENEFYSPVRPKRVARSGEQPTAALRRDGIEYVEVRSLDVSPSDPAGINQNTMRFIEAFLIFCVLEKSPKLNDQDLLEIGANHTETARRGREPDFQLSRGGNAVRLRTWASEILDKVLGVAEVIDAGDASASYAEAVRQMQEQLAHPEMLPSARLLDELRRSGSSFFEYSLDMAKKHSEYFATITPLTEQRADEFELEARDSVSRQLAIEASDDIGLDEYLRRYLSNC